MKRIALLNGPNLDRLGKREPEIYGKASLADLETALRTEFSGKAVLEFFQSNHEGALIDRVASLAETGFDGLVINPGGLNLKGSNIVQPTLASGDAIEGNPGQDGLGTLRQGFLEASNVDVAEEMVNMIIGQRAYEANSKTIQTVDQMLQLVASLKR